MRIATCGGETKWGSFLLAHLAAEWLNHGRDAIIIDATPEQELVSYLRVSPSLMSRLPRLGEEGFRIKEYLQRDISGLKASAITEYSVPTTTGREIECSSSEPLIACFSAEFPYPQIYPLTLEANARLISLGSCESDNISAQRRHHQALSIFLNHLADQPDNGIFIHLGAGQLPCITGLLGRIDLAIKVDEEDGSDETAAMIASIQQTLDRLKTPTVSFRGISRANWGHDGETSDQSSSGEENATEEELLDTDVAVALPGTTPHTLGFRDAAREIVEYAASLRPDPARFTRNNELLAQLGDVMGTATIGTKGEATRRPVAS